MNKEKLIEQFINAFCDLAKANEKVGIWDNRRFQECKKPFSEINCEYVYKTEKFSRKFVEERSIHKTILDFTFGELIKNEKI